MTYLQAEYRNPVVDADFPDAAYMRRSDGTHCLLATSVAGANLQMATSPDGVSFTVHGENVLADMPPWMITPRNFWAPDIQPEASETRLYFSTDSRKPGHMGIMLAVSRDDGPFRIVAGRDGFIVEGPSFTTIDPFIFKWEGKSYLGWGSCHSPIWLQELAADGYSFAAGSEPHRLISPRNGRYTRLLEAGGMQYNPATGKFILITSGDNTWRKGRYAMLAHVAESLYGPFPSPRQGRIILQGNERFWSPAQGWFFVDDAGDRWCYYLAVDARQPYLSSSGTGKPMFRRVTCLDRVHEDEHGYPTVNDGTPSHATQPGPRWLRR